MSNQDPQEAIEIEDLLEAERDALLNGDLDRVESLKERKEDLLARLAEQKNGLRPETYERLSKKAARNQELLLGAARGIAAVRQRLQEIRDLQSGGAIYDSEGRRTRPQPRASLEKRA